MARPADPGVAAEASRRTLLQRLRARLAGRPDTEHEQAIVRVVIGALLFLYLLPNAHVFTGGTLDPASLYFGMMLLYQLCAAAILAGILIWPGISVARRLLGVVVDLGAVTFFMSQSGSIGVPFLLIYIWVTLANGFRFGSRYLMFSLAPEQAIAPNVLTFRIQPDEGISLCFEVKVPDHDFRMATANMDFSYARGFGASSHSAYETLLMDCMLGDATLFTRSDGVEAAWRVIDPIAAAAEQSLAARFPNYSAGAWGPAEAETLIALEGARWRKP